MPQHRILRKTEPELRERELREKELREQRVVHHSLRKPERERGDYRVLQQKEHHHSLQLRELHVVHHSLQKERELHAQQIVHHIHLLRDELRDLQIVHHIHLLRDELRDLQTDHRNRLDEEQLELQRHGHLRNQLTKQRPAPRILQSSDEIGLYLFPMDEEQLDEELNRIHLGSFHIRN
jgi:hypothetical protein